MAIAAVSGRLNSFVVLSVFRLVSFFIFLFKDCGNVVSESTTSAAPSECSSLCPGNSKEHCGGANGRLSLYWSGFAATPTISDHPPFSVYGCFQ